MMNVITDYDGLQNVMLFHWNKILLTKSFRIVTSLHKAAERQIWHSQMCHIIKADHYSHQCLPHGHRSRLDLNLITDQPRTPRARNPLKDHCKGHGGSLQKNLRFCFRWLAGEKFASCARVRVWTVADLLLDGRQSVDVRGWGERASIWRRGRDQRRAGLNAGAWPDESSHHVAVVNCEIPARPRTSLRLACCGNLNVIQVFWMQLGH